MSLFRGMGVLLFAAGGVIVAAAAAKFHRLARAIRAENYHTTIVLHHWIVPIESVMLALEAGYAAALVKVLSNAAHSADLFFAVILGMVALLAYAMVYVLDLMEKDITRKKQDILKTFVNAIEMKDDYTKGHSEHVFNIVKLFCRQLAKCRIKLCDSKLLDAALLHDIGKIGVDDEILNKRGKLTDEEWAVMSGHPVTGKRLLDDTCFSLIGPWVLYHHERVDGRGYLKLNGDDIPVESRIIAIADTYSALTTDRAYRKAMSHGQAVKVMKKAAGTQLDAQLLDCFFTIEPEALRKCAPKPRVLDKGASH